MLDLCDHGDPRKWTQQHLDAADLRIACIAPTPPQGEIENDCMDVNVRGPGMYMSGDLSVFSSRTQVGTLFNHPSLSRSDGFTPLMIASCSGGGLETGNSEEEEDPSAEIITDFIYQGANLHNQTDRTGETALHLAARYARSDAAKRLLESSADANVQDNMGRTPLHSAVAADAQGVFQVTPFLHRILSFSVSLEGECELSLHSSWKTLTKACIFADFDPKSCHRSRCPHA